MAKKRRLEKPSLKGSQKVNRIELNQILFSRGVE
jgi:hypothetical protein